MCQISCRPSHITAMLHVIGCEHAFFALDYTHSHAANQENATINIVPCMRSTSRNMASFASNGIWFFSAS